ncbi:MAG TPA: flagellar hook capping protein [Sulfuricurvum kujiense]|uniref:Basal-body rod modification protein FlgD n=3 Tax=Sulfuricurvum TaxID=286130 RepID=A0A2D3WJT7_9BACT|nr:flagellar hook capping FlgD N-terminal domain-containing protein [Sulfuricurvum kujiense]DAB39300.1 MAG TPA: flagellar hook capping protein [Sulfuricurvum kujiense]
MAINAYGAYTTDAAYTGATTAATNVDKSVLGKDDFLKLLLLELKYQDPTAPMDSEKILTQTSQLATLEANENTNKALETLATSLNASLQYTGISAIGKIADTGSNGIVREKGENVDFELYFPDDVTTGKINVLDKDGKTLKTMNVGATQSGVSKYTWDGTNSGGEIVDPGIYYIEATYTKADNTTATTRVGRYPIESIKFDGGVTYAKLGSNYVDFSTISEVTNN